MNGDSFADGDGPLAEVAIANAPFVPPDLPGAAYLAALRASGVPLCMATPEGRITSVSGWDAIADLAGGKASADLWGAIVHPDDRVPGAATWVHGIAEGRPFALDVRVRSRDGAYRWYTVHATPLKDPQEHICAWLALATDSTAEHEAAAREATGSVTFERAAIGITHMSATGHFLRVNAAFCRMVGYSAEELIGLHSSAITHPDDIATDAAAIARYEVGSVDSHVTEKRYLHRDGTPIHVKLSVSGVRDAAGRMLHTVSVVEDITAHKRATEERDQLQREVAARAEQFEALFHSMTDGVIVFDARGNILLANAAIRRGLALDVDPEYGQRPATERLRLYHPRYVDGTPMPLHEVAIFRLLQGEVFTDANAQDILLRTLDGRDVLMNVTGTPTHAADGTISGAILTLREVTERQRAEQDRAEMMNYVAHELKHPLTSMSAALQLIRRRVQTGQPVPPERFTLAEHGLVRMQRMVQDLSEAARVAHSQTVLLRAPTDLAEMCREMAREQGEVTHRPIALTLPKAPLIADIDANRIEQVLANLLGNAIKYTPEPGGIRLSLRRQKGSARFAVTDEGPGIPPDALPHLFERFYRVPSIEAQGRSGLGLGLGLYVAHSLVTAHGGQMGVQSTVGKGTTFWFTLPLNSQAGKDQNAR